MADHVVSDRSRSERAPYRVALVDSHPAARSGLRRLLGETPGFEICGESDSLASGLVLVAAQRPDVIIVDLTLPDDETMAVVPAMGQQHPDGRILVFSLHEERFFAASMLQQGATGYLMKDAPSREVLRALRDVARGRRYISMRMAEHVWSMRSGRQREPAGDAASALGQRLTTRQQQILQLLGEGSSRQQIASSLSLSLKTIETHCARIKERLGLTSGRDLLCFAVSTACGGRWSMARDMTNRFAALSDRERQVLALLGRGQATREIAARLRVSVKTVEAHYAHMKRKTGWRTGRELTRMAALWTATRRVPDVPAGRRVPAEIPQ